MNLLSKSILFFFFVTVSLSGQKEKNQYIHPFSNTIGITLEGGTTFAYTDFNNNRPGFLGRGLVDYFFYSNNLGTFSLRLHAGISHIRGKNGVDHETQYQDLKDLRTSIYHIGGGYSYILSLSETLFPYAALGLSYIQFYPRGDNNSSINSLGGAKLSNNDINYTTELGIRFLMHKNFSIHVSGIYHFNPNDNLDGVWANENDDKYFSINIGIDYYFKDAQDSDGDGIADSEDFCPNTLPHFNVDNFGCPIDDDNDGVPDQNDLCLDTDIGVIVDQNGCSIDLDKDGIPDSLDMCHYTPLGIEVDEFGCPVDVDKDGIVDSIDNCLYTPFGIEVDSVGCPLDNDNDGIVDFLDQCLHTPPGILVDSVGCPDIIYDTTFNRTIIDKYIFGDDNLPEGSQDLLEELIDYILRNPQWKWRIEGHSDNISENCEDNYNISFSRAENVKNYLVKNGVGNDCLLIIGLSHFYPAADNTVPEGRKLNRRVEIIKLYN